MMIGERAGRRAGHSPLNAGNPSDAWEVAPNRGLFDQVKVVFVGSPLTQGYRRYKSRERGARLVSPRWRMPTIPRRCTTT